MEFKGRVINILPLESGTSKSTNNPWQKQSWILETVDQQYPKKIKVDAFNRAVENVHMESGKIYTVSVDAESREFNGRWYTDLRVYRAVEEGASSGGGYDTPASDPFGGASAAQDPFSAAAPASGEAAFKGSGDPTDDLPF